MTVREKYSVLFRMSLLSLCVVVSSPLQGNTTQALEQVDKIAEEPVAAGLQIVEGAVTGHIDNQPLGQILDTISQQTAFEYHGHDNLLNQPISGDFDDVPFFDALKKLLNSFNYSLVRSQDLKEPSRLYIQSLKGELTISGAVSEVLTQTEPENTAPGDLLTGLEQFTEEEERLLFEVPEEEKSPPLELLDQFEPWQELGTEITGPPIPPDVIIEDLPEFEMVESDTGPEFIDPDVPDDFLMEEFDPIVNETGPVIEETLQ